jgi:hypothetical protein
MAGLGAGGSSGGSVPCTQPGEHQLEVTCNVSVYTGPFGETARSTLLFQEDRTLRGDFQVITEAPADYIKAVVPGRDLQGSITPKEFEFASDGYLKGKIKIEGCPLNLAFEVFALYGGNEYRLGSVTCDAGKFNESHIQSSTRVDAPPPTLDLLLRSSEKVARQTTDQYEIFKGELKYPQVPVISPLRDTPATE